MTRTLRVLERHPTKWDAALINIPLCGMLRVLDRHPVKRDVAYPTMPLVGIRHRAEAAHRDKLVPAPGDAVDAGAAECAVYRRPVCAVTGMRHIAAAAHRDKHIVSVDNAFNLITITETARYC